MELSLPHGPWKEMASADWNGVPTSIYVNPEKIILVVAFPPASLAKEKSAAEILAQEKPGVLVLMRKPLVLDGSLGVVDKFLQQQKRDLTFIEKTVERRRFRYLLLEAKPAFLEFKKEELAKTVKEQYSELESLAKITEDVAANYGCSALDLNKAEDGASENLLGDPVSLFLFGSTKTKAHAEEQHNVVLGFASADNEQVELPPGELRSTFISGRSKKTRMQAMQVCIEGLMQSGIPCIVIGDTKYLHGIAFPNPDALSLEKAGLKPQGFPVKEFEIGKSFFIDLKQVSPSSFSRLFLPDSLEDALKTAWGADSLSELIEKIELAGEKEKGIVKYENSKAVRALRVVEKLNQAVFGKNSIEELQEPWKERAAVFCTFPNGARGNSEGMEGLFVESVLNSLPEIPEGEKLAVAIETDFSKLTKPALERIAFLQDRISLILNDSDKAKFTEMAMAPSLEMEFLDAGGEFVGSFTGERKKVVLRPTVATFMQ
ncbi:TPA: hypothetical protein HA244_03715 [Candidatus Micrarchaeota archaeon]|nr:hypothetical protein [Candidatus Micrarchaeota archaeon]